MDSAPAPRVYFAARKRSDIGKSLVDRLETSTKDIQHDNLDEYANAYRHYYGKENGYGITSGVTRDGEQGELAAVRVNRARAYAKALLALITGPKLNWRPQARNADANAGAATKLANNLLESMWKTGGLAGIVSNWVEQAIVFSQAFVFPEWDRGAGPALGVVGGKLVKQGDLTFHNVLPWDRKIDNTAKSARNVQWEFIRLYKSRFELAAMHDRLVDGRNGNEARDAILTASGDLRSPSVEASDREKTDDMVPVWYFFHQPCAALPLGRETIFITGDVVLRDSKLTYDSGPVVRLAADEMFDSPHAWTSFWDTLGAQELLDGIETTLATIITTLGGNNVALEQGSEAKPDVLANNVRTWTYPRGGKPPSAIQIATFPPDALKYKEMVAADQRQLMGLNDVALGQPQSAQMNAQAFAVLASMAVQQASPFQSSVTKAVGELGTVALKTYAKRATRERFLKITGKASTNLYDEQSWTGQDLSPVDAVIVDIGNPLEQTAAGRASLLQMLLQVPGAIKTPEQITQVVETGRLEPATRSASDELQLLSSEYEQLSDGICPPVHYVDNHALHYRENSAALFSKEARKNQACVVAVEQHLDAHYEALYGIPRQQDPLAHIRESILLGRQPDPTLAPPMPGMGPPMGPGGPPGTGGPPPGPPGADAGLPPQVAGPSELAAPPPPVTNPVSGQPLAMNGAPPIQ